MDTCLDSRRRIAPTALKLLQNSSQARAALGSMHFKKLSLPQAQKHALSFTFPYPLRLCAAEV